MTKEEIILILKEWNFWDTPPKSTHLREDYQAQIARKAQSNEVIFVKGVRRCGKSTLLINHIKTLLEQGIPTTQILFVNLEDPRFAQHLTLTLLEEIKSAYNYYINPDEKPYIFLDEIQNIENFEKWLLKEYELKSAYLFATGSNSKLLSREISTSLSGRYLDVLVTPLSFKEFLSFKNITIDSPYALLAQTHIVQKAYDEYLAFGGFPKVVLTQDIQNKRSELKSYFDSILLRDIVARYKLDNFLALEQLALFLLSSISNQISINKIKNHLGVSFEMANNYFEYLQNTYIIEALPLFDYSYKKQLVNTKKIYSIDTGLTRSVSFEVGTKKGDYLENIIFLELKRRYERLFYYKTAQNYEVDFVVQNQGKITHLIQASYDITDTKTKTREIRALTKAKEELSLDAKDTKFIILTHSPSEHIIIDGTTIEVINIWNWLVLE